MVNIIIMKIDQVINKLLWFTISNIYEQHIAINPYISCHNTHYYNVVHG